jgi:hypothetical protein
MQFSKECFEKGFYVWDPILFATSVNNTVQYVQVWCICEVHRVYSIGKR